MRTGLAARIATRLGAALIAATFLLAPSLGHARDTVRFEGYAPGTVVVKTSQRRLYYVLGNGRAIRYVVGVGKAGMQWSGRSSITGKYIKPDFEFPPDLRRRNGPAVIPAGSPRNPLGAAALTLHADYAIHGTNNPGSIGRFVSHGCIRMHNSDVMDLYRRVDVGTPVIVTR